MDYRSRERKRNYNHWIRFRGHNVALDLLDVPFFPFAREVDLSDPYIRLWFNVVQRAIWDYQDPQKAIREYIAMIEIRRQPDKAEKMIVREQNDLDRFFFPIVSKPHNLTWISEQISTEPEAFRSGVLRYIRRFERGEEN